MHIFVFLYYFQTSPAETENFESTEEKSSEQKPRWILFQNGQDTDEGMFIPRGLCRPWMQYI